MPVMLVIAMAAVVGPTIVIIRSVIGITPVIAVVAPWIISIISWISVAVTIGGITEADSD
jgi:hypothetical protein